MSHTYICPKCLARHGALVGGKSQIVANEKRHLRLQPDYLRDPRSPRRRRQVDVVLGSAQTPDPQNDEPWLPPRARR